MSTECSGRDGLDGEDQCCLHDLPDDDEHAPGRVCCWCGDIYLPEHEGLKHGEYRPSTRGARMTESEAKDAVKPEAAPLSVEEMRAIVEKARHGTALTPEEEARAIATAVAIYRLINWILGHERDAGVKLIPALETVVEAFEGPTDYYDGEACMDACRLACRGRDGLEAHLVASAIQYLWRSGRKGAAITDLLKARDMVDRLVRELGGGK